MPRNAACRVCGQSPTVKSHLMPRALVHDMRGHGNYVISGGLREAGSRYRQSGTWDRTLLCEEHERALHPFDDYAVRWIRSFERAPRLEGRPVHLLDNPRPDLLAGFVSAVIWRHALSHQSAPYDMDLGPWEYQLRQQLFHGGSCRPRFLVFSQRWMSGGQHLKELMVPPFRNNAWGRRGWEFEVGGLMFIVILDQRRVELAGPRFLANEKDPVPVMELPDRELVDRPGMIDIAVNMFRHEYLREQAAAGQQAGPEPDFT